MPFQWGAENRKSKLNEDKVIQIRAFLVKGLMHTEIAKRFGVSARCISLIKGRKNWGHVKGSLDPRSKDYVGHDRARKLGAPCLCEDGEREMNCPHHGR